MLLQHRSGVRNFTDEPGYDWGAPGEPDAMLALVLNKSADFRPGTRYSYSNSNYLLIGRILDKTLGYSHRDYIKAQILTPLHLTHTYGLMSEVNPDDIMSGYVTGYPGDAKPLNFVVPGGSMVATAQDVGIFLRALNDGSLLSDEEQAIYSSVYTYDHTGLLPGYQSIARYHKDSDMVVVQFTSTSGKNSWMTSEAVYNRIVRILRKH
jgi:CubicO group peptidase (beta-lactamase class C family)